ncbi:MAG: replicative DNA helicase [Puniceicoccales bacterium]|jgi:replicative DNA helicase|nr:replicative DNA helicase [Puniceicoccales bacterium]
MSGISRTPPYSVDFEQALLASCIIEGGQESIATCIQEKIYPTSFYMPAHQVIFKALLDLYAENSPVSELVLAEKLSSRRELEKVGGYDYINSITSRIDTPVHIVYYINRVRDLDLLRKIIKISSESIESAYAGVSDVSQFVETVEKAIFDLSESRLSDSAQHIRSAIDNAIVLVQKLLQNRGELSGVGSGFGDLDRLTFGFHPGEMIVVAARPSVGKTSLALNIAENAVIKPEGKTVVPTLFFSLEMSSEQLSMRLLCGRAGINMTKFRDGFITKESAINLNKVANEFKNAPLWIDESTNMSITEMRAKARRRYNKNKFGLVIIDYLQLIAGTDARVNREQQISEISRGVKAMAKELNVPVIVLSQLNRESEKEKRQPRLSDLRESGAIEQDADVVMLLSKKREEDTDKEISSDLVIRELIVAKQRNGPTGLVQLAFRKSLTRFENYADKDI